jgi:hypothetical protein
MKTGGTLKTEADLRIVFLHKNRKYNVTILYDNVVTEVCDYSGITKNMIHSIYLQAKRLLMEWHYE